MPTYSRRKFIRDTSLSAFGAGFAGVPRCFAGDPSYRAELPDMLVGYLTRQGNALAAKWDIERRKLKTAAQTLARSREVREKVLAMFGGLPERTELGAVKTSGLRRNGYTVENVMFQSRPDFWVTGNVYVPEGRGPFPAVISPAGHYDDAGRVPSYQLCHMLMAQSGILVFAYDPIGQGERRYHWNPATGKYEIGQIGFEHCFFGQRLLFTGEAFLLYLIWDGIRALDYLVSRAEVDPERLGSTGHSGGSWMTQCIALLDDRVKCVVCNEPGELYHLWPHDTQPQANFRVLDADYHILPAAWNGVDYCDIYQAIAPRPMLLTDEEGPLSGNPRYLLARKHIEDCYARLGVPERFATLESGDRHYLTHKLRLATVDWFSRWFLNRPGPIVEPDHEPEPVRNLYCTPTGSLRDAGRGDTMHSLLVKKVAPLPPSWKQPGSALEVADFRRRLLESIRQVLRFEDSGRPLSVRRVMTVPRRGYRIEQIEFLSEPGIYVPTWVMIPDHVRPPYSPVIYANDLGRQRVSVGGEGGLLEKLVRQGTVVIAVDVRGIGDTHPQRNERYRPMAFWNLYSFETAMAYLAWSLNRCLLGMRVLDLVRTVTYALGRDDVDRSGVAIIGSGMASILTLFAASLDDRIHNAICDGPLLSYRTIADADRFSHPASVFALDVLHHFDLMHVAAAVAPRRLTLLSPVDQVKRPVPPVTAQAAYEFTRSTYGAAGAANHFSIQTNTNDDSLADQYLALLRSKSAGKPARE